MVSKNLPVSVGEPVITAMVSTGDAGGLACPEEPPTAGSMVFLYVEVMQGFNF